ncbi:hypothetical protein Tco_0639860 [Tanacetum coccineum]
MGFPESVQNRFGLSKYEDPQGALPKLLQTTTVAQYQSEFEKLRNRVTDTTSHHDVAHEEDEAVESGDISILNTLVGHGSPRSLQLPLQKLGKVTHDYAQQNMEFNLVNKTYSLQGDESLCMKRMSLHRMQALLETNDVYGIYELHSLLDEEQENRTISMATGTGHAEIDQLLVQCDSLFQVPTYLPPHRLIDHRIHLLPNTKPVNVRPYRYPHYQKGEMEKLVNEMLSQGIIRFSHNPFSLHVLLVKKKDGNYRSCVYYRALNAVSVKDKFLIPTTDEMFDELRRLYMESKKKLYVGEREMEDGAPKRGSVCEVYGNVMRRLQESGARDEDYINTALLDYEAETGVSFKLRHCWEVFKRSPKWMQIEVPKFLAKSGKGQIERLHYMKKKGSRSSGSSNTNDEALARLMEYKQRQEDMRFCMQPYDHLTRDALNHMEALRAEIKAKYNLPY